MQAIGTLLALAIAIAVPWFQHRLAAKKESEKESLVARSHALASLHQLRLWKFSLDHAIAEFNKADKPVSYGVWTRLKEVTNLTKIDVRMVREAKDLGPASQSTQTFFFHATMANIAADNGTYGDSPESHERAFRLHATRALESCLRAIRVLSAIAGKDEPTAYQTEPDWM